MYIERPRDASPDRVRKVTLLRAPTSGVEVDRGIGDSGREGGGGHKEGRGTEGGGLFLSRQHTQFRPRSQDRRQSRRPRQEGKRQDPNPFWAPRRARFGFRAQGPRTEIPLAKKRRISSREQAGMEEDCTNGAKTQRWFPPLLRRTVSKQNRANAERYEIPLYRIGETVWRRGGRRRQRRRRRRRGGKEGGRRCGSKDGGTNGGGVGPGGEGKGEGGGVPGHPRTK